MNTLTVVEDIPTKCPQYKRGFRNITFSDECKLGQKSFITLD